MNRTFVILLIACCVALLYSCNPGKQLQRKQEAAINTVLASKPLLDKAGKQWAELNPCINDTGILIFLPGDTAFQRDTLIEVFTDTVTKVHTLYKNVVTTKMVRDTVKQFIRDDRAINMLLKENTTLNDSLIHANRRNEAMALSQRQIGYTAKMMLFALMRQWWFWVIVVVLALYKFRHPLITALSNLKR